MSNRKKKRRRNRPAESASGNGTKGTAHRQAAVGREEAAAEARRERPEGAALPERRPMFGQRLREASPYPSFLSTTSRGLVAAGSSIEALGLAFLAVLALWGAFHALGAGDLVDPREMANLMAVPPLHTLSLETYVAFSAIPVAAPPLKLAMAVGLTLGRGLVVGAMIALLARGLGWTEERPMARWARAIPKLLLISLAMFGVSAALPFLLLTLVPGGLGQIALLAGPLAGLHFLVFAPVTAIVDGTSYRDAIRFSARAARLPGGSHLALTFAYFALAMFAASALPPFGQATPTVGTWAIVLLVTFLHVMVLAAFVFRWFAVRDVVPKGPASPRPRPTRGGVRPARPGGLLGRFGR